MEKPKYLGRLHSQVEAIYHSIKKIAVSRHQLKQAGTRSAGIHSDNTRYSYLRRWHSIADFAILHGFRNLFDLNNETLQLWFDGEMHRGLSLSTLEQSRAAIGMLAKGLSAFCKQNGHERVFHFDIQIPTEVRNLLGKRRPWRGMGRAYERPAELVDAIADAGYRLFFRLQLEGGLRSEGTGHAHDPRSKIELSLSNLKGIYDDPFFRGEKVGLVDQTEKGGKVSRHYVSSELYLELESYLTENGPIRGDYRDYLEAINNAAILTHQFISGRGTHGAKHNFAKQFIRKGIKSGHSQEEIFGECSKRCSHRRMSVVPKYYG